MYTSFCQRLVMGIHVVMEEFCHLITIYKWLFCFLRDALSAPIVTLKKDALSAPIITLKGYDHHTKNLDTDKQTDLQSTVLAILLAT